MIIVQRNIPQGKLILYEKPWEHQYIANTKHNRACLEKLPDVESTIELDLFFCVHDFSRDWYRWLNDERYLQGWQSRGDVNGI